MKLLEYEAKQILRNCNLPVPDGSLVDNSSKFGASCVLKAQVPVGGRAKAGGIIVVNNQTDYDSALTKLKDLEIDGHKTSAIYAEELLDIKRELYIAIVINYQKACLELVAHPEGGVDIEAHAVETFYRQTIDKQNYKHLGQTVADYLDINDLAFVLGDLIENLYSCFIQNDALTLEINPLVVTAQNQLVAADCKLELDNAACFRHAEDWDFVTQHQTSNFVNLDALGNVATIANGAGLAMATVDAIADAQLSPANFLDIGGGANEASVLAVFEKLMKYEKLEAIVINIFAGITHCDEVAKAVIAAQSQIDNLPKLYIRLSGTNSEIAEQMLKQAGIDFYKDLPACITAIKKDIAT